ncbi:MAG: hypothetical protein OXP12_07620 [Thaumarchaeota archaeon]|nr:hypothetical protein [Nitrososphaerota archaeon]MDE0526408.1 hypothetical protein [Nitrososphaerota archaeon]
MPANSDPLTREDLQRCLNAILDIGKDNGLSSIVIQSGILHRIAGGYSGKDHRMPVCCGVMRSRMQECDKILPSSLKKYGASLRVLYLLK